LKTEFTPKELELIDEVYDEYMAMQTRQESESDIYGIVEEIWNDLKCKEKIVVSVADNPDEVYETLVKKESFATNKIEEYWSLWHVGYAAKCDFANRIGIELDQTKLRQFLTWVRCCPYVAFVNGRVVVSRKPEELHFNENDQLHNEDGMAVRFRKNWGVWAINGVKVDEQIVMSPETQTIDQIKNEQNAEVKVIRLERYGYEKFMDGINAKVIHERRNDIEGSNEYLISGEGMKALLCICKSTKKRFCLQVHDDCKTCEEAQVYLSGGLSKRIISAS